MTNNTKEYKDLTELLLGPVRNRPAMYLGDAKISSLAKFIVGYNIGFIAGKAPDKQLDSYFGETGFIEWFFKKHNLKQTSFWQTPFLDEANGDEYKALQIFFDYLEKYSQQLKSANG